MKLLRKLVEIIGWIVIGFVVVIALIVLVLYIANPSNPLGFC